MRGALLAASVLALSVLVWPGAGAHGCDVFPLVHFQHCLIECTTEQLAVPGHLCDFGWGGDPPIVGPLPVPLPPI